MERLVIEDIKGLPQIQTNCCAQHVLQLVINDEMEENKPLLTRVRKFVKVARCSLVKAYWNNKGFSHPVLDVETPWDSTYIMFKSINLVKDVIIEKSEKKSDLCKTRYQINRLVLKS